MNEPDYIALVNGLTRWEGAIPWMYQDTHGLVTCGIGNYLRTAEDACELPFVAGSAPATPDQIARAFRIVAGKKAGMASGHYRLIPSVELTDNTMRALAATRIRGEFVPGIRRSFTRFDDYPTAAQIALVDCAYNLGVAGLAKFRKLITACEAGEWSTAARECHRSTCRPERNDWTAQQFAGLVPHTQDVA